MAEVIEHWVMESKRRGEEIVVIIRNKTTREEVEIKVNPLFLASLVMDNEIRKEGR